jgi:nicotinate-nucleotide adenylyltransferase
VTSIGIMGGTFDPVHIGHLAIAEEAREALKLDRVLFVPAGRPPHKPKRAVTAVHHRVAMVELAIIDNPAFELSPIEVDRDGPSYTVDTVEALARGQDGWRSPGERDLTLILSAETFAELPTWYQPGRIFDVARVAVVPREGYPAPDPAWIASAFPEAKARVTYLEGPMLGVSSTGIRERVAGGRSIRYLVPTPVEAYILNHHLYRRPTRS